MSIIKTFNNFPLDIQEKAKNIAKPLKENPSLEFLIEIAEGIKEKIEKNNSTINTSLEVNEIQEEKFHEQIVLEEWKTGYPEWENFDKITSHKDGVVFEGIEGLEGKKIQRENFKVETPNEVDVFSVPESELKNMTDKEIDNLKNE